MLPVYYTVNFLGSLGLTLWDAVFHFFVLTWTHLSLLHIVLESCGSCHCQTVCFAGLSPLSSSLYFLTLEEVLPWVSKLLNRILELECLIRLQTTENVDLVQVRCWRLQCPINAVWRVQDCLGLAGVRQCEERGVRRTYDISGKWNILCG